MASIYQRNSYWWIKYRDPLRPLTDKNGKQIPRRESTGFRVGNGVETRAAKEIEAQWTLKERQTKPIDMLGRWETWVMEFIKNPEHRISVRTVERYITAWRTLSIFLAERNIEMPRQLTYHNCFDYVTWRIQPEKRKRKYRSGINTAILEFKLFRWIMREAVRRGYASSNIAREVVLKRIGKKVYPDYSDDELKVIWDAIASEIEPIQTCYRRSFAIALLHGVRLNETNVNPMKDVKLNGITVKGHDQPIPTIRFLQKGGRERIKPLHAQLVPMFTRLQSERADLTYCMDRNGDRWRWGNQWTKFFIRHGIKETNANACFHSLRVTVENVLREAGIPKEIREHYLSHEHDNDDVNAGYDRIKLREMLVCHDPLARSWLEI